MQSAESSKPDDTREGKCSVCGVRSTTRCSNCCQAFYCSVNHQKENWKTHKVNCKPFKIFSNEKVGRYLVASRDIKVGDVILKEPPLVKGPAQITGPVCVGCLQGLDEANHMECERCGWPICKRQCQASPDHQPECHMTVARGAKVSIEHFITPHPIYQSLMPLRCLVLKDSDPDKWEKLNKLESHCDARRGSDQWRSDREGVAKFIPRFFKCGDRWSEEEILKITGILQINGHEIPLTDPPFVAVYDSASLIEHSCRPNLTKSFTKKGDVLFWAPVEIKKGEHLSICYSDALWGTSSRQDHLMQTKMFKCDCERCRDVTEFGTNYSAVKCSGARTVKGQELCDGLLYPESLEKWDNNWKCNKCGYEADNSTIGNILQRSGKDLSAMKGTVENCLKYIEHYSKYLPPTHHYMCDVKVILAQLIGAGGPSQLQSTPDDLLNMKIKLCREMVKIFQTIAPAENRSLGCIRFELHAALAELARRNAKNPDIDCRIFLEESLFNAEEVVRMLSREPTVLTEGKICAQAQINVNSLRIMMGLVPL